MEATAIINPSGSITQTGHTDRVPWWSFTKLALSIATLRLAERGALALDTPLPGEPFTTRQLLRHQAGLPDYGTLSRYQADVAACKPPWPQTRLLAATHAGRLRYEPGTGWAYSNIGYLKIAQQIEHISGQTLAEALAELVFNPAELKSPRLATTPGHLTGVQMGSATRYHPGWVYHGLIVGTILDAARLLWLLADGRLLQPATFAQMIQSHALPQYRSAIHPDPAYGLGVMLAAENPQAHPMGHEGEGPGSKIAVYTTQRRVAAIWTQHPSPTDATKRAHEMLAHQA